MVKHKTTGWEKKSEFLQAAIYLQDEIFTKIADFKKEKPVFDGDLY